MTKNPDHVHNGRIGGLARALRAGDPREAIKPARLGWERRFEREVDPNGVLPDAERLRLADIAKRLYMARLGKKSAQARRKGVGAKAKGEAA